MRIWVERWQHECCGELFAVGDEVSWTVTPDDGWLRELLGKEYGDGVFWEEHHGDGGDSVTGVVGRIRVAHVRLEEAEDEERPGAVVLTPVPSSLVLTDVTKTPSWLDEIERDGAEVKPYGMLVDLNEATARSR